MLINGADLIRIILIYSNIWLSLKRPEIWRCLFLLPMTSVTPVSGCLNISSLRMLSSYFPKCFKCTFNSTKLYFERPCQNILPLFVFALATYSIRQLFIVFGYCPFFEAHGYLSRILFFNKFICVGNVLLKHLQSLLTFYFSVL